MQTNKWEAFLSDPELKDSTKYRGRHNGEYLFEKICHDSLECFNNYLAILSLIGVHDVKISSIDLAQLYSKKGAIETAVFAIYSLGEQYQDLPDSSEEWPSAIQLIGSQLGEVQFMAEGFQDVDELIAGVEKDLITMAKANLRGLQAIYVDIRAENYKQLLITAKYY